MGSADPLRGQRATVALVVVALVAVFTVTAFWQSRRVAVPLLTTTVGIEVTGDRQGIVPGEQPAWVDGTRVIAPDRATPLQVVDARALAAEQRSWLGASTGTAAAAGPYRDLSRAMLLDLHTLTLPTGSRALAPVAGWPQLWRYVWPRDAAFVAVAYARTGHVDDAVRILRFLQVVQAEDGSFQARYLPDGSGPPDDRGLQEDGPGWALWATAEVARALPDRVERSAVLRGLASLVERSTHRLLHRIDPSTGLPRPSSDYWEIPEDRLTLGTAALSLAGLEASASLARMSTAHPREAVRLQHRADALRSAIEGSFGAQGYPRHLGGRPDAAVTFLLPPYQPTALAGAQRAAAAAIRQLGRPAGGLAPGASWKDDGISWTPETALFALAGASNGQHPQARAWLAWLAAHRTAQGSVPEKVLSDGSPAGPAPLAWTAALVVLTIDTLQR
jgi:glucoamylase